VSIPIHPLLPITALQHLPAPIAVRSPSAIAATSNITSHSCADLLYHTRKIPRHPRPNATPQTRLWLTSVEWAARRHGSVLGQNLVAIEHAGRTVTSGFTVIRGDERGLSLPIPLLLPVPRSPSRYFLLVPSIVLTPLLQTRNATTAYRYTCRRQSSIILYRKTRNSTRAAT
jgi:hypothetical protein